ncbi:hypothetical protein S7335_828 [Synechococcus sp. PCC 7335]|nr:hypothetical protein S7335_828 [Synechococcus sp. PCC 7335]
MSAAATAPLFSAWLVNSSRYLLTARGVKDSLAFTFSLSQYYYRLGCRREVTIAKPVIALVRPASL